MLPHWIHANSRGRWSKQLEPPVVLQTVAGGHFRFLQRDLMDHRSDLWLGLPGTSTEEPSAQSELLRALNQGLIRHFVPFRGLPTLNQPPGAPLWRCYRTDNTPGCPIRSDPVSQLAEFEAAVLSGTFSVVSVAFFSATGPSTWTWGEHERMNISCCSFCLSSYISENVIRGRAD